MASLKQLKLKRQAILKTRKVTRAMEAVSAVKMRKSQQLALDARGFAFAALRILLHLSASSEFASAKYVHPNQAGKRGIFLVTSDKGLAGSLNSAVLKLTQELLSGEDKENVVFYCVGKRGYEFAKREGYKVAFYQENKKDFLPIDDVSQLSGEFLQAFSRGELKSVELIYTNFVSTFEQKPTSAKILPLDVEEYKRLIYSIIPEKGKFSQLREELENLEKVAYKIETEKESLLDELVPALVDSAVFHSLLESKASEHSARMVAMRNATEKAGEVAHELKLQFNKARQAAITKEISEITSGIEAMRE